MTRMEKYGLLMGWWRVVKRAYLLVGVFACLGEKKSRGKKKSLRVRYEIYAERVKKEGKPLSFIQAQKYDRLGQFLLKYPGFVFQLQFVSLDHWRQSVAKGKSLMRAIGDILTEEEIQFWKGAVEMGEVPALGQISRNAGSEDDEEEEEEESGVQKEGGAEDVCIYCKQMREGSEVWNCSECSAFFHETCAGYADKTVCHDLTLQKSKDVELETLAYCRYVLGKDGAYCGRCAERNYGSEGYCGVFGQRGLPFCVAADAAGWVLLLSNLEYVCSQSS